MKKLTAKDLVDQFYELAPMNAYGSAVKVQLSERRYAIGTMSSSTDVLHGNIQITNVVVVTDGAEWRAAEDAIIEILTLENP